MWKSIPLLGLSLAAFVGLNLADTDPAQPWWQVEVYQVVLMSNDVWRIDSGDLFVFASMALFFVELVRSTTSSEAALINHTFSVLVFIGALFLFLTRPGYGNSVFFILTVMTLLDFLAGFIITVITARRDVSVG